MTMEVAGSVCLVTGANRGLGRAIVEALLDAGAAKVYAASRQPSAIAISDSRVVPLTLDVADPAQIAAAAVRAADAQVLINKDRKSVV